jgi:hypothetical protein
MKEFWAMKASPPRISVKWLLLAVALAGVAFAVVRLAEPMDRGSAIRVARRHALAAYPNIDLDDYAISAPDRVDWFTEWKVYFRHKAKDAGFLIDVDGGDLYNGYRVRVFVDNEWGSRP